MKKDHIMLFVGLALISIILMSYNRLNRSDIDTYDIYPHSGIRHTSSDDLKFDTDAEKAIFAAIVIDMLAYNNEVEYQAKQRSFMKLKDSVGSLDCNQKVKCLISGLIDEKLDLHERLSSDYTQQLYDALQRAKATQNCEEKSIEEKLQIEGINYPSITEKAFLYVEKIPIMESPIPVWQRMQNMDTSLFDK